jgi:hypothetical protein
LTRRSRSTGAFARARTRLNGITVAGWIVGTRSDRREVFDLHATVKTKVTREGPPVHPRQRLDPDVEAGAVAATVEFAL